MQAKKGKLPQQNPFSMAPLRAKLEDTLRKLDGKLNKRRISEETDASQQSKQQRTLPAFLSAASSSTLVSSAIGHPTTTVHNPSSSISAPLPMGLPYDRSPGISQAPNQNFPHPAAESPYPTAGTWDVHDARAMQTMQSRCSSSSKQAADFSTSAGSSSAHPIDLTGSPPSSPPSRASRDSLEGKYFPESMDGADPRGSGSSRRNNGTGLGSLTDEEYAKAYQAQLNYDTQGFAGSSGRDSFGRDSLDIPNFFDPPEERDTAFDPRAFGSSLQSMSCAKCKVPIPLDWETVVTRTKKFMKDRGVIHPFVQCPKCRMYSCCGAGCLQYRRAIDHESLDVHRAEVKISWCCDAGRLFLVFSLACGLQPPPGQAMAQEEATLGLGGRLRTRLKSRSDPLGTSPENLKKLGVGPAPAQSKPPKAHKASYRESLLSKGTGYGGPEGPGHHPYTLAGQHLPQLPGSSSKAKAQPKVEDQQLAHCYSALATLLPSPARDGAADFDYCEQPAVEYMLSRSPLLLKLSETLRLQSVDDMGANTALYSSMLDLLCAMSDHAKLLQLVYLDQTLHPQAQQLAETVFSHAADTGSSNGHASLESSKPLNSLLQSLARHCEYFSQTASACQGEFKSADEQNLLALAKRVVDAAKYLNEARQSVILPSPTEYPEQASKPSSTPLSNVRTRARFAREIASAERERVKEELTSWHREHCVRELPDEKILEYFYYSENAKSIDPSKAAKGRMRKLVTQITSLRSDLPEGVFVRHGSSRLDVIKVLIVGPDDTPYQYGLFEFDLFCNKDFPLRPPEMHFRTTGRGRITFNPNLYNNGKVCLSLLGTWSGQGWEPERSTLLQILVSIQAMIFTAQPWYNEPGRELHLDANQSKAYNKQIWGYTLQHAITYWLSERLAAPDKGKQPAPESPDRKPPAAVPAKLPIKLPVKPSAKPPSKPPSKPLAKLTAKHPAKAQAQNKLTAAHIPKPPQGAPAPPPLNAFPGYPQYLFDETAPLFAEPFGFGLAEGGDELWANGPPTVPMPGAFPPPVSTHSKQEAAFGSAKSKFSLSWAKTKHPVESPFQYQPPKPSGSTSEPPSTIPGMLQAHASYAQPWVPPPPLAAGPMPSGTAKQGQALPSPPFTVYPQPQPASGGPPLPPPPPGPGLWGSMGYPTTYPTPEEMSAMLQGDLDKLPAFAAWASGSSGASSPFSDYSRGDPTEPVGNTAVDRKDDYVWGDVIRMHFSLKGKMIASAAKDSQYTTDPKALKELEQMLENHDFA